MVIVFQDDMTSPFQMQSLTSHQNHVLVIVSPHQDGYKYELGNARVVILGKNGVTAFTPELPDPVIITKDAVGRDFFLHKRISFI